MTRSAIAPPGFQPVAAPGATVCAEKDFLAVGLAGLAGLPDGVPVVAPLALDGRHYALACRYLGGEKFLRPCPASRFDIHCAIVKGIGYGALTFLIGQVTVLDEGDIVNVLGISARTLRRQSETPDKPMPADLASKAWLFAETWAKATEIFGGKEEAERWLSSPAMGLDRQRPIALLQTVQGAELVNDFLTRLEYGVYT